jgi:hypothetical protein
MLRTEANMKEKAKQAAERLDAYFSTLSTNAEADYPEGHDPAEDAKTVREALEG